MSYPELSAEELITEYRRGTTTPTEVVGSLLERIDALEPELNAITETLEGAVRQAQAATELWRKDSHAYREYPLLGVPVIIKEKHAIAGYDVDQALPAAAVTAAADHPVVERLRAAGAILLARSTNPEFCAATFTASLERGVTRNPWDTSMSPGGSSGGSGAALAAGYAPLATGSDIGGSTRIPASMCGVVGYKAPYGVVPGVHPSTMDWYRSDSAMARTVGDALLMHNTISGQHPADPHSLPKKPVEVAAAGASVQGKKIGYSTALGNFNVDVDTAANVERSALLLEEQGAVVSAVNPSWTTEEIMEAALAHYGHTLAPVMADTLEATGAAASPYIGEFIETTLQAAARLPLYNTFERESAIRAELARLFADVDVLLAPVTAWGQYPAQGPAETVNADGEHYWKDYLAIPFNIANRHPALAVPTGINRFGLPTGVQIVGRPYDEKSVFEVGFVLERAIGWEHRFTSAAPNVTTAATAAT